jgi:hypothetical protein
MIIQEITLHSYSTSAIPPIIGLFTTIDEWALFLVMRCANVYTIASSLENQFVTHKEAALTDLRILYKRYLEFLTT